MKQLTTFLILAALLVCSGLNCHNRQADSPDMLAKADCGAPAAGAANWATLHTQSDSIDATLTALFMRCAVLEVVAGGGRPYSPGAAVGNPILLVSPVDGAPGIWVPPSAVAADTSGRR